MTPELRKALFACTSKDHPNKTLQGILFCDDYIVASDSTQLVRVKKEFDFDNYVELEDGSITEWEYPNVKHGIFFESINPTEREDLQMLIKATRLIPKSENETGKHIALDFRGKMVYPPVLLKALAVFEANNESQIRVDICPDRIQIAGENTSAVVMTLEAKGNPNARCKEAYTPAQILAMAELL